MSGNLVKEKEKTTLAEKTEQAAKSAHKIPRERIERLEERLKKDDEIGRHTVEPTMNDQEEKVNNACIL